MEQQITEMEFGRVSSCKGNSFDVSGCFKFQNVESSGLTLSRFDYHMIAQYVAFSKNIRIDFFHFESMHNIRMDQIDVQIRAV